MVITGALITAIRTLTCLPVPGRGSDNEAHSLIAFPLVGALVGAVVALIGWIVGGLLEWPAGAGVAGAVASAWMTRGLHLDGLGDAADAIYGGRTRERRLQIMKDTHMGAFGTIAIILSVLVKAAALARLVSLSAWLWIPLPFVLSRTSLVLLAVVLPYARREGGTAGNIVGNAKAWHLSVAIGLAIGCCWAAAGGPGLVLFVLSCLPTLVLAVWMKSVFGGVTGDLLGMANETTECSLLFAAAALLPLLRP